MTKTDFTQIPTELGSEPRWSLLDPVSGQPAAERETLSMAVFHSAAAADAWLSFDLAEGPFVVVVFDHCRNPETEVIEPSTLDVLSRLNSYTEVGMDPHALTCVVRADLSEAEARFYAGPPVWVLGPRSQARVVLTGNHLDGRPLSVGERTQELGAILGAFGSEPISLN